MKRFLLVVTLLSAAIASKAQLVAGGSFGLTTITEKVDGDKLAQAFSFDITPSVGYALGDWEFGLIFEYSYNKTTMTTGSKQTETASAYAIGPYANYCFGNIGKFYFSVEAASLFGFTDGERTVNLQLLPVATYEINDRWDIDFFSDVLSVNYLWTKTEENNLSVSNFNLLANDGRIFAIGFSYKF